jgi:hypothetical protein
MGVSQKVLKFTCFLVKNQGGKNMGKKRRNLLICSHFHNFYPFGPYMKFNNVHEILSTNLTNIHKCLEQLLFSRGLNLFDSLNNIAFIFSILDQNEYIFAIFLLHGKWFFHFTYSEELLRNRCTVLHRLQQIVFLVDLLFGNP